MPPTARDYLSLIQYRDSAQDRYHTAFRNERSLRFEHAAAVRELDDAKAVYNAAIAALKTAPAALAMAAE